MGNPATGIPFLPGGFEKSDNLDSLLENPSYQSTIDWENLSVDPPGMKGMQLDFEEKTEITLESLIKSEIEDETFNWIPKFKPHEEVSDDLIDDPEPEVAVVDEIEESQIIETVEQESKFWVTATVISHRYI